MRVFLRFLAMVMCLCIFFGCAVSTKQNLYEPCEGEEIGEEDGEVAIGRIAVFTTIINGESATLRNYAPETLGELRPGEEVFFADINGEKTVRAIFTRYEAVVMDGVFEISISEEE